MRRRLWLSLMSVSLALGSSGFAAARPGGSRGHAPAVKIFAPGKSAAPATANAAAAAAGALTGVTGLPSAPPIESPMPVPAIAAPIATVPGIAPLSPQLSTQLSSGGTAAPNLAMSPGSSTASSSQSAPSTPGGGGATLQDCMGFWDRATHMTKAEWRATCVRTAFGLRQ